MMGLDKMGDMELGGGLSYPSALSGGGAPGAFGGAFGGLGGNNEEDAMLAAAIAASMQDMAPEEAERRAIEASLAEQPQQKEQPMAMAGAHQSN